MLAHVITNTDCHGAMHVSILHTTQTLAVQSTNQN